jgi:hypothetical protein
MSAVAGFASTQGHTQEKPACIFFVYKSSGSEIQAAHPQSWPGISGKRERSLG